MKRILSLGLVLAIATVAAAPAVWAKAGDKPRIAVLEFKNKAENQWWYSHGGTAAQDVFVTELVKSGKFRVIEREQLSALMNEKGLSLSGDLDPKTAIRAGKLLGVNYFLTGALTEFGTAGNNVNTPGFRGLPGVSVNKKKFTAAFNARLIDAETGEIVWADEGRGENATSKVYVGGFGGGVDDDAMFDKVLKPIIQQLCASLKAADI
jgi:curli biogenesis system outer membrane secretion channel CsgG